MSKKNIMTILALCILAVVPSSSVTAGGNLEHQEIADLVFRDLDVPVYDVHNGIYLGFLSADPDLHRNHTVIEMEPTGVRVITLQNFEEDEDYHGSFSKGSSLDKTTRDEIIVTAGRLVYKPYVGNAVWEYIKWDDTRGVIQGQLEENEIISMRSDAYTEFCYAKNGHAIVHTQSGRTIITDTNAFNELIWRRGIHSSYEAYTTRYLPSDQMIALGSAFYQDPSRAKDFETAEHDNAIGKWNDPQSQNPHVKITSWEPPTDTHSGLKGYFTKWDKISSTIPTYTDSDLSEVTLYDGRWYFHIRSIDGAGNWNKAGNGMYSTAHLGPICIDTLAPLAVTGLTSSTHAINKWSKEKNITMAWIAAGDDPSIAGSVLDTSGVGGYSIAWNTSTDTTKDIGNVTSCSKQLSDGTHTFKIKSVDKAGNWDDAVVSAGPYLIDLTKPWIFITPIKSYPGKNADGSRRVHARVFFVRVEDLKMNGVYSGLATVSFNGRTSTYDGRQAMSTSIYMPTPFRLTVTAMDRAGNKSSSTKLNPDPYFIQYPETIIFDPLLKEFSEDVISPITSIGIKDDVTIPYEIPEPLNVLTRMFNSQGNLIKVI
ncbi:MAG: hypothetical protein Q8R31_03770, partial [Candidatus Omnitrophota bacterium]|nr:hypothetical protein [Candidatus Omnitrophota bacterium]